MKKTLCLLLAMTMFSFLAVCPMPDARGESRELTILIYICGSDLESEDGEASTDIREMVSSGIGSSGAVNVLLATGGASRWNGYPFSTRNVQYYRLDQSGPVLLKDAGRMSMGDARTLNSFIRYGLANAPANRYMMILWDHGGGPVHGVCNDENYRDDGLSLAELKKGLTDGLQGNRLDIIGFDCCLMNCVDLCSDLYGIADYSVVSQELVSGTGLDYDGWMKPVANNPGITSREIARLIVDTYIADNARGRRGSTATMTVVDSARMPQVMEAANAFSKSLASMLSTNLAGVVRLRGQLTSFGEFMDTDASDLVDVFDMCDAFSALLPQESADLKEAALQAVCYNSTTGDIAGYAHGLSFFLPYKTVLSEKKDILSHYSGQKDSYSALASTLTSQVASSGYAMSASSYTPNNFYSSYDNSCSGSLCDIWDGYYGDYCSFNDAYDACGGNIWSGLNSTCGSVWDGYSTCSGIWDGYLQSQPVSTPSASGIWTGLTDQPEPTPVPQPAATTPQGQQADAAAALNNIWAGLLHPGNEYYQPGENNQNVQAGISEAVSAEGMLESAESYFSTSALSAQMVYSLQLTKEDLNHLSTANGVLNKKEGDEIIRYGNMGKTTIDWSTGLILSMFDGSWPMLEGQMIRAEYFYAEESGSVRFVIPARVNGLKMYLLGSSSADGETTLLGATQGYDENGFAIRGVIPLEEGMTIYPLFTAVSADGTEREYEGSAVVIPADGAKLTWGKIPSGNYQYCFALTDLSGQAHYTDRIPLTF